MKVVILIRALTPGGAERQVVELARALHARGVGVTVVVYYPGGEFESSLRAAGVPMVSLNKTGRWDGPGFVFRLVRTLRRERADVIHGFLLTENILLALLKPFLRPARIVWGARASRMDIRGYDWLYRALYRGEAMLSGGADLIIANSAAGAVSARRRGFPPARTIVIRNGIDVARFAPDRDARNRLRTEWGVDADEVLVGRVGRLDPMKDYPNFLAAARKLARDNPKARFVCVGDGPEVCRQELATLSREAGLDGRVLWAGVRTDMSAVYNALDLLCSSSAFGEGLPNTIAEAMACGVPCVVTDVGDSAWLVGDPASVVPPGDSEALARALGTAIKRLGQNGIPGGTHARRRIEGLFSVDQLADRTLDALNAAVNRRVAQYAASCVDDACAMK